MGMNPLIHGPNADLPSLLDKEFDVNYHSFMILREDLLTNRPM